jgi:hypothetical protein
VERIGNLGKKKVFKGQKMSSYEDTDGKAIAVYRPIHRMVTVDPRARSPSSEAPVAAMIKSGFVAPMVNYIKSGGEDDLAEARKLAREDMKEPFDSVVEAHTDVVAEHYSNELRDAETVNPGRKDDAKQAMVIITNRVQKSLREARSETGKLFT